MNVDFFKYRVSDPAIGRFWSVDPLGSQYSHNSLYAFQENKLGLGVELEGRELTGFEENPSDDSFLFAKLATPAFYDTKHAIYNTALRVVGSNLRAGYKVENGQEVFETNFTRQEPANTVKGVFKEAISTLADVVVILPGGSIEGKALSQTSKSQTTRAIKTGIDGAKAAQKAITPKDLERVDLPNLKKHENSTSENWSEGNIAQQVGYGFVDGIYSMFADKHLNGYAFDSYDDKMSTKVSGLLTFLGPILNEIPTGAKIVQTSILSRSVGAARSGFSKTLQTGGHTLSNSTLKALGLTKEQGKIAIEGLKRAEKLPNNFHGKIMGNGDLVNPRSNDIVGNLFDYLK